MIPWGLILRIGGPIVLVVALIVGIRAYIASERADERGKVTAEYTAAERQAEIKDLKHALAEAKARVGITEQSNVDLSQSLSSGLAERDAYVRRMLASFGRAAQSSGEAGVAGSSGQPVSTDQATLMDDVAICEQNTKRLINARDWYDRQRSLDTDKIEVAP